MRVLIYIEPFPIRNTLEHFNDVARRFIPFLTGASNIDARMFANNGTFGIVGENNITPVANRLIRSTPDEERIFESYMQPWQEGGIATWLQLMAGEGAITESALQVLRRIWAIFPFEVIIHWGENGAVTQLLDEYPVTRIAMELGCTRPPFFDSLVMDPLGTNGAGIIPKLGLNDLREIVGNRPMSRHAALFGFSQDLRAPGYAEQFQPLPQDLSLRLPREHLVFLPLQLFDDANLLQFSPYSTISDVVLDVVPKLAEQGYTTLIKPHPASQHRKGAELANNIARNILRPWEGQVIWMNQGAFVPNARLITQADFTVTVNSSVGFEALYFDKPVVVLGDAVYKPKGLFPTLDTMLSGDFDQAGYLDGIGILRRFMLGGYLQPEKIRGDASAFGNRIGLIDHLSRRYADNPAAFAREFWRTVAPTQQAIAESAMFRGTSMPGEGEFGVPPSPVNEVIAPSKILEAESPAELAYRAIVSRLLPHAAAETLESFIDWLVPLWTTRKGRFWIVETGEFVDPAYYLATHPDVKKAGVDPVSHFCTHGIIEMRAPRATIKGATIEQTFANLELAAASVFADFILPDFPLSDDDAEIRKTQMDAIGASLVHRSRRIAVVAHLYYRNMLPQILSKLGMIEEAFDLIVTLPDWGNRRIIEQVREAYPDAIFYRAANRGRDIGPFMDVLPAIIGKYDAVLKIQTKQGYYDLAGRLIPRFGKIWHDEALSALLGSKERVNAILAAFRADPKLKMIGPEPYLLSLEDYPYHDGGELAGQMLNGPREESNAFFAGTMFWVRPDCLQALAAEVPLTRFAPEDGAIDRRLAHLVERMFGQAATLNGGKIAGAPVDPDVPLLFDPQPASIKMGAYLTGRLEELRRLAAGTNCGALIW